MFVTILKQHVVEYTLIFVGADALRWHYAIRAGPRRDVERRPRTLLKGQE